MSAAPLVDLWIWPLDVSSSVRAGYHALLSDAEKHRAARFVFPILAERFIAAHGRMREILGEAVGCPPAALDFIVNAHGKPELAQGGVHFSLSHSGDLAALGVASFPLGVDIEVIRPVERALPERFFSPLERQGLRTLADGPWAPAFFRCWTRKEAVVKALGLGLSFPLDDFDVTYLEADPPRLTRLAGEPDAPRHWQIHHLDVTADCVGAIAARATGWVVRRRSRLP